VAGGKKNYEKKSLVEKIVEEKVWTTISSPLADARAVEFMHNWRKTVTVLQK
jgi:hypothetical protein